MSTALKSTIKNKNFILFLTILFLVEFIRGAYLLSFLPIYGVHSLGFTLGIIGAATSAHYITDTLAKIFIGYLLDNFPAKWIVSLGLLISLGGLLVTPVLTHGYELIISSAILGIGVSPIWILCLSQVDENERGRQMGIVYMFWLVGMGLGPILTNFVIERNQQAVFTFFIIVWAFILLVSLFIKSVRNQKVELVPFTDQLSALVRQCKSMKPLLPGMVLQTMVAGMLVPIMPEFVNRILHLAPRDYSLLLIFGGAAAVLLMIPMGRLADHINMKILLVAGFGGLAVALALISFIHSFWPVMLIAVFLGASYATLLPAWNALLSYYVPPDNAGAGWGIFSSIEGLGIIIGPAIGGLLTQFSGFLPTIIITAVILAAMTLFYAVYPFKTPENQSSYAESVNNS